MPLELVIFFLLVLNVLYVITSYVVSIRIKFVELLFFIFFIVFSLFIILFINDVLMLYFCLELIAFLSYIFIGFFNTGPRDRYEGLIKYFIISSLASVLVIFGISILYVNTLQTGFLQITVVYLSASHLNLYSIFGVVIIIVGFLFKLGAFPGLVWLVDVYESVSLPVLNFILTIYKFSVFFVFMKLIFYVFFMFNVVWMPVIIISAISSLIIGALGALLQFKLKRFIGYGSVNQLGYSLLALSTGTLLGVQNAFSFLILYLLTNTTLFFLLTTYEAKTSKQLIYLSDLSSIKTIFQNNFVIVFVILIMSIANLPPLSSFFTKYFLIQHLMFLSYYNSVWVVLVCSLISMFYYLRVLKVFMFDLPVSYMPKFSILVVTTQTILNFSIQFFYVYYIHRRRGVNLGYVNVMLNFLFLEAGSILIIINIFVLAFFFIL